MFIVMGLFSLLCSTLPLPIEMKSFCVSLIEQAKWRETLETFFTYLGLNRCTPEKYLTKSERRFLEWEDRKQANMVKTRRGWRSSIQIRMKFWIFEVDGSFYTVFSETETPSFTLDISPPLFTTSAASSGHLQICAKEMNLKSTWLLLMSKTR